MNFFETITPEQAVQILKTFHLESNRPDSNNPFATSGVATQIAIMHKDDTLGGKCLHVLNTISSQRTACDLAGSANYITLTRFGSMGSQNEDDLRLIIGDRFSGISTHITFTVMPVTKIPAEVTE